MNPLLFPEILAVVFDYLPTPTLNACRLVSHTWNEEACIQLHRRLEINFCSLAEVENYVEQCQESDILDEIPNVCVKKLFPISIYKFTGTWSSNPWQFPMLSFFNNVQNCLTNLELRASGWSLWDYWMFFSEVELPYLVKLSFECPSKQDQFLSIANIPNRPYLKLSTLKDLEVFELTQKFIPFVCTIIKSNRNLTSIALREYRIVRTLPCALLESILVQGEIQDLDHFHIDYFLTNEHLSAILKRYPLHFQTLSFALQSNTDPNLMYNFLKSTAHTLTILNLEYEYMWEKIHLDQFKLPPMENLKHLSIKYMKGSLSSLLVNVQSHNLRTLTLSGYEGVERTREETSALTTSLEKLSIVSSPACRFYIDEICELFPALKFLKLQGQLTDETLHSIITKLTFLEEVFLAPQRSYFSDEGLLGSKWEDSHERGLRTCHGSPCICQLKFLTTLQLERNPRISDDVVNALAHCNSLKNLSLKGPRLTDRALLSLLDNLDLETLTFHGGQISQQAFSQATQKLPECNVQQMSCTDVRIVLQSRDNLISCRVI